VSRTTAAEYSANINAAEKASKPPGVIMTSGVGGEHLDAVLRVHRPRPAVTAEPVDVSLINGREPEEWETALIVEARMRERAAAVALTGGLT
jgi:hypothetical protein